MKSLNTVSTLSCFIILAACGEGAPPMAETSARLDEAQAAVNVPFVANFYTDLAGLLPDDSCPPGHLLNTQAGAGAGTHLGAFDVMITFCVDPGDLLDDGQLTEGESLPYQQGVGTFTSANGDELHIRIAGAVVPSTNPDYDFEFSDPFQIVGGTGRFAGAAGAGMTSSFVDFQAQRTTHEWRARLTLPHGR